MRLLPSAPCTIVAAGLLAGCSGSNLATPNASAPVGTQANHLVNGRFIPTKLQPAPRTVVDRVMPDGRHKKKGAAGVYGSTNNSSGLSIINGYKGADPKNAPPICSLSANNVDDIAVDSKGDLIVPEYWLRSITIYKPNCGSKIGAIEDDRGFPDDAASFDATNNTIIVSNFMGTLDAGGISVCTLSGGCTTFLTSNSIWSLAGVALAKNGDCWGSGFNDYGTATMTYFKHCSGSGEAATGWRNTYYGGLDIDTHGNIVAVDAYPVPQLWIYHGCNPACGVVAGPFPLHGEGVWGHLNRTGTQWIGGDYQNGMLDVYSYTTKALTYEYSISNGLSIGEGVGGAAFSLPSEQ